MRNALAACVIYLILCCIPLHAEEVRFDGGWLDCTWSVDSQYLTIQAGIDDSSTPAETYMWVLTVYSHRFEDGLFAWQIHYSEDIDSVLVLPNDFLTARHFTTEHLGIEAELAVSGTELNLRLPILGAIPRLVVAGDLIELHALWIQQEPLISMRVPAPENLAILQMGGGASIPGSENETVSTSPLPEVDRFEQGQPISHQFVLQGQPAPEVLQRIVLSYTLMRIHETQANEFVRFAHISYDFATDIYSYTIDTSRLEPGWYSLLIGSSNSELSYRTELAIIDPME